jgi:hypothetical protein
MRESPVSHRRSPGDAPGFPWFVTLLSLLLGLGIYVHSTRPALAEAERLEQRERELRRDIDAAIQAVAEEQHHTGELEHNPEAVMRELDARGLTEEDADQAAVHQLEFSSDGTPLSPSGRPPSGEPAAAKRDRATGNAESNR